MQATTLLAEDLLESLTRVIEPAWGINIVDLGLVYGIELDCDTATIRVTMTSPDTPTREGLLAAIEATLRRRHPSLASVRIDLTWDPPWREDFITAEGERQLAAPIVPATMDAPVTEAGILASLKLVIDPEIGVNIVDLGLVYGVDVREVEVEVVMTLTTPGCPLHASIEAAVRRTIETRYPGIRHVTLDLVWEPP